MGITRWESFGNGSKTKTWEVFFFFFVCLYIYIYIYIISCYTATMIWWKQRYKWEGIRIYRMGMEGNVNVKIHSRPSPTHIPLATHNYWNQGQPVAGSRGVAAVGQLGLSVSRHYEHVYTSDFPSATVLSRRESNSHRPITFVWLWPATQHDVCPLTKFEGGLNLLHEADADAVISLESTATAALTK